MTPIDSAPTALFGYSIGVIYECDRAGKPSGMRMSFMSPYNSCAYKTQGKIHS